MFFNLNSFYSISSLINFLRFFLLVESADTFCSQNPIFPGGIIELQCSRLVAVVIVSAGQNAPVLFPPSPVRLITRISIPRFHRARKVGN